MPPKNIVTGQKVSPNMHNRARQMRHSMTPPSKSCGNACVQVGWKDFIFAGSRSSTTTSLISIAIKPAW
jgi:hypothetical protein